MRTALLILVLVGLLVSALAYGAYLWWSMSEVEISFHGLIALFLGALVSLALGAGLMALVFYSSRHGHDEKPHKPLD